MEEKETPVIITLSESIIKKLIEWVPRKEAKFIKADPLFWTVDRYYLLQCLKVGAWLDSVLLSSDKRITITVSSEIAEIIRWFQHRYQK